MEKLNFRKQVPKNLAMNVLSFLINVFVGLWIIPYLVKHIGVAAYGLVPLAMFFSEYVSVIIQSLNAAINRFLLIALQKKDFYQANRIFNTSLVIMLVFAFLQAILMAFIVFDLSTFIDFPEALAYDAALLFLFTFLGFLLSLFRAVFATPLFAHNRLDLLRINDISQTLIRVGMIILLFSADEPLLRYVGIANFIASLLVFFQTFYFSRKLAPQIKIDLFLFDKGRVKELSNMGGWILVQQIGGLLFLKIDLYIVNKFIGANQAGEFAAVIQWNNLIRTMMAILSGVIAPIVMIYYARNEIDKLIDLSKIAVKLMGLVLAVSVGVLCALSEDILGLWLGESFKNLEGIMILSLVPLVINLAVLPLFTINVAYNRVKFPGIVTFVLGITNFAFALFLVVQTELGVYGVLIATAIILTLKNAVFTPIYAAKILEINSLTFITPLFSGLFGFGFVYLIALTGSTMLSIDSVIELIFILCMTVLISLPIIFIGIFSSEERKLILDFIPGKIKDKVNKLKTL